ncbi:hypothetical protein TRSC58_07137 [Trypanosoma rangeli SC58]|uniref:Mucin-associated surface protein (MASP) n=1 Tax=Trypanosoma rangeli SC58 TaxID=429131 RepID=A0A061IS91_TRYRA|nr:hypothetical protein TRSC58_07137 [Trypanosoma rangeli SC58]
MRMAGRVLLACALCVLCCVGGGAQASETQVANNTEDGRATLYKNWYFLVEEECRDEHKNKTANATAILNCTFERMNDIYSYLYNVDLRKRNANDDAAAGSSAEEKNPAPQAEGGDGSPAQPGAEPPQHPAKASQPQVSPEVEQRLKDDSAEGEAKLREEARAAAASQKTPASATATASHAAKAAHGNSDGSTAASHCTSPIALILLACAAAAAMAAA